jgi:hypothetical protein
METRDPISGQLVTDGAARVTTEKTGIAHNRNINAAQTTYAEATNTATWTDAEGVTELRIQARSPTGGAVQADEMFLVVINAPDETTADAWLNDAGGAAQDVIYEAGNLSEPIIIRRTSSIRRVDFLPISSAMRFVIGAV